METTQGQVTVASRHFTASALVFDAEARHVLLVQHLLTGMWQFPGGHVDPDEDGAECAVRETAEETGLDIRLLQQPAVETGYGRLLVPPFQVAEHPAPASPDWNEPAHRHLDMLYLAVAEEGEVLPQLAEVSGVRWWSVDVLTLDPAETEHVRSDVPIALRLAWGERAVIALRAGRLHARMAARTPA